MELEMLNGYTVIAREFDRNGHPVIMAVRPALLRSAFEYVTAWHSPGDKEWWAGHYFSSFDNAISDYRQRVTL